MSLTKGMCFMLNWFKGSLFRKIIGIAILVILILALVLGGLYLWLDSFVGKTGGLEPTVPTLSSEEEASELGEPDDNELDPIFEQAEDIFKGKDVVNILLVGQDRRAHQKRQRSDSMILCTINRSTKTLTMTSFLRDMWVYIPGKYNQRLNVPYLVGGFPLLNETLQYNFGVSADHNVEIDFSGFQQVIDLVGGVDIELTSAEAKHLNKNANREFKDGTEWNLKEGLNHLDGAQALAYSRIRKIDSDFSRTNRQRVVLSTLLEKAKQLDALELYNLAKSIMPLVRTDLDTPEILGLIVDVFPVLGEMEVVSQRIPLKGQYSYANKKGASVIVLSEKNMQAAKELLTETMKEK